jgi:hypothetical protein
MSQQFFTQIDENNVVVDVHCVTQEFMEANPDRYPGVWVETFLGVEGKTYAGQGYIYDPIAKDFTPPPYTPVEPEVSKP